MCGILELSLGIKILAAVEVPLKEDSCQDRRGKEGGAKWSGILNFVY